MTTAKENMGLCSILCSLYQSIHYKIHAEVHTESQSYKEVHSHKPYQPHSIQAAAFSSTSAPFVPLPAVGACHALSWRTKLSRCRGLQTSGSLQYTIKRQRAGPHRLVQRVTFHAPKVKESEVGKVDSCYPGSSLQADSCLLGNAWLCI